MQDNRSPDPQTVALGTTLADLSGNMMMALLEQSQDCVKVMDPSGSLAFMNRNGRCSFEIDDFCMVEGQNWWDIWPEESQLMVKRAVSDAVLGRESRFEAFCATAKGTPKWWDVTVSPVRNNAGQIVQIVSISRDVTEQVKSKEALEIMALEMRHRLRNAFAVSSAIATVSAKDAPEHQTFAHDLAARFAALAVAQTRMMQSDSGPIRLVGLFDDLNAPYSGLIMDCPPDIVVDEQQLRVIALTLGELTTNSLKYGALGRGLGARLSAAVANQRLTLVWHETGAKAVSNPSEIPSGTGHLLIVRMAKVYGGTFSVDWTVDGLTATLDLPN